jgi:hypothetical protein
VQTASAASNGQGIQHQVSALPHHAARAGRPVPPCEARTRCVHVSTLTRGGEASDSTQAAALGMQQAAAAAATACGSCVVRPVCTHLGEAGWAAAAPLIRYWAAMSEGSCAETTVYGVDVLKHRFLVLLLSPLLCFAVPACSTCGLTRRTLVKCSVRPRPWPSSGDTPTSSACMQYHLLGQRALRLTASSCWTTV